MLFDSLQRPLYFITLVIAGFAAILGIILVMHLFNHQKTKNTVNNKILFIFSFLSIGYVCFALAEITWFLIFDVFQQLPSASMPDVYWVAGSFCLLLAFVTFSVFVHAQHGQVRHGLALFLFAAMVLGGVFYFLLKMGILGGSTTLGQDFLSHFYPIMSALILIASFSVYLFSDKLDTFKNNLILFMIANAAFLLGDLLYTSYITQEVYGLGGVLSDIFYIAAYALCSGSFFSLIFKVGDNSEE